jgi:hypothetical protein
LHDEDGNPKGPRAHEEAATIASERAHRAVQEAHDGLEHATGRLTDGERAGLEALVTRAGVLVDAAKSSAGVRALGRAERAPGGSRGKARGHENKVRGFVPIVTWGSRRLSCPRCGDLVIRFRCSSHAPLELRDELCPGEHCGRVLSCCIPASAYDVVLSLKPNPGPRRTRRPR